MFIEGSGGSALSGADLQLDASWPGLSAPSDGIEIDPDEMEAIADELEQEVNALRSAGGAGSLPNLSSAASLTPGSFGTWATAVEMETGYNEAHAFVTHYYEALADTAAATAQLLRDTARRYRQGDELSGSGMQAQQAAMDHSDIPVA